MFGVCLYTLYGFSQEYGLHFYFMKTHSRPCGRLQYHTVFILPTMTLS